jgi:hypothetical protein
MDVYMVKRTDKISWCQDYAMVVIAQDKLHAERCARCSSDDFKKASLKVEQVSTDKESVILKANTGA